MKNKLISVLVILTMLISTTAATVFAEREEAVSGFNYNASNFSTLDLTDKTGYALDSDGNLVVTMQGESENGSKLNLGGNGMQGERIQFRMVYRNTDKATTSGYIGSDNCFVNAGGAFRIDRGGKNSGSVVAADTVINGGDIFDTNYTTTLFYYAVVADINTVTGEIEYAVWKKTTLADALKQNDAPGTDTVRRTFQGTAASASGANSSLGDIILNNIPSAPGTQHDIIVYSIALEKIETAPDVKEFTYNSENFSDLNLYGKNGFSVQNGTLVMDMQKNKGEGSRLYLGGNGVTGENVQFKIVYKNRNTATLAKYTGEDSFVYGGGVFQLPMMAKHIGNLQMGTNSSGTLGNVIANGELFHQYITTLIVKINTVTGEANYAVWFDSKLDTALARNDVSDTTGAKYSGSAYSLAGPNAAFTDITLSTNPAADYASASTIDVYEVSLMDIGKEEPASGFNYDTTNFDELVLDGKEGFSLDEDGNLVMTMQNEAGKGSKLSLGGNGVKGDNVQFKMIYQNMNEATDSEYYHENSFVIGGGFFNVFKLGKQVGRLMLTEGAVINGDLFDAGNGDVPYYTTLIINMNTITGNAEFAAWKNLTLDQARARNDVSGVDTEGQIAFGSGTSLAGANKALTDIILNTVPSVIKSVAPTIKVYEVSLEDIGFVDFSISEFAEDGESVAATVTMKNTSSKDKDYVLIIAAYGDDNEMLDFITKPAKLNAETESATDSVTLPKHKDAVSYKAFVWNTLSGIKPWAASKPLNGN